MGRPDLNFWSASVGKHCRDATAQRNFARGNCREAQFERPHVVGVAAGRRESVRTTGEVVGDISGSAGVVSRKMKSKVPIGITTSCEFS